ncbi:Gluconate transport-inducing protein [Phaffia rhodozyma]|uniref:Gluconate transport-inducing protein n=1 Tax=Phaffia rhodozyma TaxID=264483 RepID=A0A0F7SJD5_PHARH|nr:Gluconate transport-inducing protein [Phaffia rhodozyma]
MADQPVSLPTATSVLLETSDDALILLESVRQGLLPRTVRRLSKADRERYIRDGAVFIWEEKETQMQRWTDGKKWSCSKVAGDFLVYEELYTFTEGSSSQAPRKIDNGLIKQTFSVNLQLPDQSPKKFHVISYHCPKSIAKLTVPSFDPAYVGLNLSCWKHPSASSHSSAMPVVPSEPSTTSIPTSMNIPSSSKQSPFLTSGSPSPNGTHGSFPQPRPESDGVSKWTNLPPRTGPTFPSDELLTRPYPPRQPRSTTFTHQPPKSGSKHRRDRSRSWTASERSSPSSSSRSYPLEAMSSDPARFVHSRPSSLPLPVDWPPVQPTSGFLPIPLQSQMSSSSTSVMSPYYTPQSYAQYPTHSPNLLPPRQPGFLQSAHRPASMPSSMPSISSYETDSFNSRCSTDSSLFAGSDGRTLPLPSASKSLPSTSTGDSDGHPNQLQGNRLAEKGWKPGLDQESKRMLSMLGFSI